MESERANKYLEHQYDAYKDNHSTGAVVADDYNQFARQAVEIAEKELKEKTIEAYWLGCPFKYHNLCGSEVINKGDIYHACEGNCEYMQKFKELINK